MRLLLFLSALLTGLTGAISGGQRTDAPVVQQSLAHALETVVEASAQKPATLRSRMIVAHAEIISEPELQSARMFRLSLPAFDIARVHEKLLV